MIEGPRFNSLSAVREANAADPVFFWVATGRLHDIVPAIAPVRMSARTFALLNLFFIAILLGAVPFVRVRKAPALVLAGIAGAIEVLNGVGHTAGAIWFRGYVPGVATAPFLFVTGVLVLRELFLGDVNALKEE